MDFINFLCLFSFVWVSIQTEISNKFTLNSFKILANSAGWKVKKYWIDENKYYSIFLLEK